MEVQERDSVYNDKTICFAYLLQTSFHGSSSTQIRV